MATASTRTGVHSFEDFCWIVEDGQKADLIDGTIYMASPDSTDADELFGWLRSLLLLYVNQMKLGRVFGSRVAFRLDELNGPEPDIAFLRNARKSQIRRGFVLGPPDLAIEIVSPDSIERDYERKRILNEAAGVREYWIIDDFEQKVTVLRLDGKGKYRDIRPRKGRFHSLVISGFWLDASWLWQRSLPDLLEVLRFFRGPA
jgi:Uma2 family endonuclease